MLIVQKDIIAQNKKLPDNSACLDCHNDPDISMEKKGKTISLTVKDFTLPRSVHSGHKCTDCHIGFNPEEVPHKAVITPVDCKGCHADYTRLHQFHPQFQHAVNSGRADVNCKSCHGTHDVTSPKNPNSKMSFTNSTNFCGSCHKDIKNQHLGSEHSVLISKNNPNAPTCIYCHKSHVTPKSVKDKNVLKLNQEKLCISCHIKNPTNSFSRSLIDYEKSVHGKAIMSGNTHAATCIDCHGVHNLKKASDQNSTVNHYRIPDVCGKCHMTITNEYSMSIHGLQLKKGNPDVPGCTYCHGEHAITAQIKVNDKVISDNKMDFNQLVSTKMLECVHCHTDAKMMAKYNISTVDKAHDWLPNKVAHWETVRCVDCHSSYEPPNLSHNILPPGKTIKKCEECHSKTSILMTKLFKHEKEKSREKMGFINGTILNDAYVVGTTRNIYLDVVSLTLMGLTLLGISIHGFIRWYFRKIKISSDGNEEIAETKNNDE
jgi:predicted CXXCH cytochrome family protein